MTTIDEPRSAFSELSRARLRAHAREPHTIIGVFLGFVTLLLLFAALDALIAYQTAQESQLLQDNLALIGVLGFLGVALGGTAMPIVAEREAGLLRLLGTTPLRNTVLLFAHALAGVLLLGLECLVLLTLATPPDLASAFKIAMTLGLGAIMLLGFGYLLSVRAARTDSFRHLGYLVPLLVLVTSGALFPLDAVVTPVRTAMLALPTTWFASALTGLVSGQDSPIPLWLAWTLLGAVSLIMWVAAVRLFRWRE